jgi:hypothetical protein
MCYIPCCITYLLKNPRRNDRKETIPALLHFTFLPLPTSLPKLIEVRVAVFASKYCMRHLNPSPTVPKSKNDRCGVKLPHQPFPPRTQHTFAIYLMYVSADCRTVAHTSKHKTTQDIRAGRSRDRVDLGCDTKKLVFILFFPSHLFPVLVLNGEGISGRRGRGMNS